MKNKEVLIELRKLKKFFPLKKRSLFQRESLYVRANEDISLKIYKNETFGLVGESGCGKSTLGRVILQLYPPTSGSVLYYGVDIYDINPEYVLKEIDMLPRFQKNAIRAYQTSLVIDKKIMVLKQKSDKLRSEIDLKAIEAKERILMEKLIELEKNEKKEIDNLVNDLKKHLHKNAVNEKINEEDNYNERINNLCQILQNEPDNSTIIDLIDFLPFQHNHILSSYKMILRLQKQIYNIKEEIDGLKRNKGLDKRIKYLEEKSKDFKKEASRQLREGSKICGDLILEKEIVAISHLLKEEEHLKRQKIGLEKKINYLISKVDSGGSEADFLKEVDVLKPKLEATKESLEVVQKKIKGYHHSNILEITERTLDLQYQKKLAGNKEVGINLQKLNKHEMRKLRQRLQMIFQDPYSSLDPRMTVGQAISEAVVEHGLYEKGSKELEEYIIDIMKKCGLDHYMIHRYPHQFSGGQRQRIVIARALALKPEFIVCDESVSALDVSIQSQILNLLSGLKEQQNLTYLFISHDLSVIKHISDRIGVMYLGDIVELSDTESLYLDPFHPYTKALISAIPSITERKAQIILEGDIPSNIFPPSGCKFRTRCPMARRVCAKEKPALREVVDGRYVACHFYEETKNLK